MLVGVTSLDERVTAAEERMLLCVVAPELSSWVRSRLNDDVFPLPLAQRIVEESNGYVRGKDDLRPYWTEGLRRDGDLHFTLEGMYVGVDTLVINYRNQANRRVNEVLVFEGSLVIEGHGAYEAL